jgi:hypothetical protein
MTCTLFSPMLCRSTQQCISLQNRLQYMGIMDKTLDNGTCSTVNFKLIEKPHRIKNGGWADKDNLDIYIKELTG